MKKLIIGIFLLVTAGIYSAQTITFDQTTIEYGTIAENSDGYRVFKFKNTGDKPLILSNVKPSCGCTSPKWSKEEILPGKTGEITVGYDTRIKGNFRRSIEVYSNDRKNKRTTIFITGNVK